MDDGTRISVEVENFLRAARAKETAKCADMLRQNASLINAVEAGGFSALHFAAFNGDTAMIEMLLAHTPNLELRNYDGNSPLMMAAKGRQHAAIKQLIDSGADVNARTPTGGTAAHFAASMGYVDTVRQLVALGADVSHADCATGTLLHWAAHSGDVDCVGAMLYEFRIPVDAPDAHGGTALFTALFMQRAAAVDFLLEHGADPNARIAADGTAPLHIAAEQSGGGGAKVLVEFGADPLATNADGETPVGIAEKGNRAAVLKELRKPTLSAERRAEDAARLKAQGNKVFEKGENAKAAKFYTLAIHMDRNNHVFFSNRAACYFNQRAYKAAYWDAMRCVALAPEWPKGYFRLAASQLAMKQIEETLQTCETGLRLDPKNKDLLAIKEEARRQFRAG